MTEAILHFKSFSKKRKGKILLSGNSGITNFFVKMHRSHEISEKLSIFHDFFQRRENNFRRTDFLFYFLFYFFF